MQRGEWHLSETIATDAARADRLDRGSQQTPRWREPDSNPRSPVRKLAPDVGTPTIIDGMRPRKSGSQRTRRWREKDSNPRSPVREAAVTGRARLTAAAFPFSRKGPTRSREGPTVLTLFPLPPPGLSQGCIPQLFGVVSAGPAWYSRA
jgi:hypothetical protein